MIVKSNKSIWILEDDPEAQFVYSGILELRYSIRIFDTIKTLEEALTYSGRHVAERPHLLIADLRLPDGNFLEFLGRDFTFELLKVPFLVVSSYDDLDILRSCFDEGALDYLTKPFVKTELVAKIERFIGTPSPAEKIDSNLNLDPQTLKIKRGEDIIAHLTVRELQIFSLIHRAKGRPVSREEIQAAVWGNICVTSKTLDVHIFNLRRKLASSNLRIHLHPFGGYSLSGDWMDTQFVAK